MLTLKRPLALVAVVASIAAGFAADSIASRSSDTTVHASRSSDTTVHAAGSSASTVHASRSSARTVHASRSSASTVHSAGCTYVKIGGQRRCLAAGKFCTRQWEKPYRQHGFSCSYLDRNDRYRLRRLKKN